MKLELEPEETRELLSLIVDRIAEEADLSTKDAAALKRWRSETMKAGSDATKDLTDRVNAELERTLRLKEKSAIQRPDWR